MTRKIHLGILVFYAYVILCFSLTFIGPTEEKETQAVISAKAEALQIFSLLGKVISCKVCIW